MDKHKGLIVFGLAILLSSINQIEIPLIIINDLAQAENISTTHSPILDIRKQKKETEGKLKERLQIQMEILVQREVLKTSNNRNAIAKNEADYQKSIKEIQSLFDTTGVTGDMLKDAVAEPTEYENSVWQILLTFDDRGSELFAKTTREVAGTGLCLGMFLNGQLISSPIVGAEHQGKGITGGRAVITGSFMPNIAAELASQFRAGSLHK